MELQEKTTQKSEKQVESDQEKTTTSLIDNLKDPAYRGHLLRWMVLPTLSWSMGIADSLAGTTSLDLQIITSISKEKAALYITAFNLGYVLGSLLGGAWFGKTNSYFIMLTTGCLAGVSCIGTPYCSTFALMFIMRCALGFFLGTMICVINAEHIEIWGTRGEALLQLIHAVYAVGGVVGPLLAEPFLADKDTPDKTTHHLNSTLLPRNNLTDLTTISTLYQRTNVMEHSNWTLSAWSNVTEATMSIQRRTTNVYSAFLITGIILIATSAPAVIVVLTSKKSKQIQEKIQIAKEQVNRKLPLPLNIFLVLCVFLFFFMYCSVEITFTSFLKNFLEDQYEEVTSQHATYITTYFWASFAACRFVSILTSKYVNAIRQLYVHFSLVVSAFTAFLVSALYSRVDLLTIFTVVAGLACSAVFPAMISWTEAEIMKVTGPVSAVIMVGSSAGVSLVPIVVGHLMGNYSNLWFCYCVMGAIVVTLLLFTFLLLFNRCYVNKVYGKLNEAERSNTETKLEVSKSDWA